MKSRFLQTRKTLRCVLFILLLSVAGLTKGYSYDFSAVCSTGQTLYYNITDATNHYVALTFPGTPGTSGPNAWSGYTKPVGDIILPETVEYNSIVYSVTSIGYNAFYGCNELTGNLTIPGLITTIESSAFCGCSGFAGDLTIPNSVTTIGSSAFYGCSGFTGNLTIPNSVTAIGSSAFYGCINLTGTLTIPDSVTTIGDYAFYNCRGFTGVLTIPNSMTSISDYAFYLCSGLTSVEISNSVTIIGGRAFQYCSSIEELTIGEGVTTILSYAFWGCSQLQTVHFNAVSCTSMYTRIGEYSSEYYYSVFGKESSPIVNLTIGPNVTRIPDYAFRNCYYTSGNLELPNSLSDLGSYAFDDCGFTSITSFRRTPPSASSTSFYRMNYNIPIIVPEGCISNYRGALGWSNFTNYQSFPNPVASVCSTGQTLYFRIDSENRVLLSYPGTSVSNPWPGTYEKPTGNVIIPDSIEYINYPGASSSVTLPVIGIDPYALYDCNELTQVTIPIGITTIGEYAFYGCGGLTQMTIPTEIMSIGNCAFWNCPALQTVYYNAVNCTSMQSFGGYSVFSSNSIGSAPALTRVVIGNGVQRIPNYAFKGSVDIYQRLVIPATVTEIGNSAFYGCNSLVQMVIQGNSLQTIGGEAFRGCSALRNALVLPNSVISVGQYAFYGCSTLPSLTIGTSTTTIGDYAFWNCSSMTTVNFNAANCTSMDTDSQYSVFGSTTPITTLNIGENVSIIPDFAFRNSPNIIGGLVLPNDLAIIGQYAFSNCTGYSGDLLIPNSVTSIGQSAFEDCNGFNGTLTLPTNESFLAITDSAFSGCNGLMESLVIPNSVTSIGISAFRDCGGFSGLVISNSATSIGSSAFRNCNGLTGFLEIPNSVLTIGEYAFYDCSGISELTIGESVTSIDGYAFWNCPSITIVHFNATNCTQMYTRQESSSSNYQYYSVFGGVNLTMVNLSIGENVTNIPAYAFRNCTNLINGIVIPDITTNIGQYAFYGAKSSELTIGESVASIGWYAFWNCPNLAMVHFNAINCTQMYTCLNSYYYSVFSPDTNGGNPVISTLTIGENVTSIPDYAFRNCSNMTNNLVIPNSVINIGQYAFSGSSGQNRTLLLGNAVASIGQYAFQGCSGFTGDLVIPNSVTTLNQYAFQGCSGFDGSLIIGSGVQTINQYTFANCSGFLGSLIVGRQVNSIGSYAFQNCSGFTVLISENPTPPTAVNNSFQSMNFSIPLYVPYGMMPAYQSAAGWSQFTNRVEQCVFDLLDNDLWSDEMNWYAFELPGPTDVVCVNSNCHMDMDANVLHLYVLNLNDVLTINNGNTLSSTYGIGTLQPSQLVIEDGGQLVNTISNAYGTVKKQINGYGTDGGGWYTLASPIYNGTATSTLATDNYDLYAYDETSTTWLNQKMEGSIDKLNPAQGYLYANQSPKTVNFAGQLNASNAEISIPITYTSGSLAGFNLVGNPYTNNISITDVKINGNSQTAFYRAEGSDNLVAYVAEDNVPIKVGEGFFVKAIENGVLTIGDTTARSENNELGSYVCLVLKMNDESDFRQAQVVERVYLSMNKGTTLEKISTDSNTIQLFFENNGKRYAVTDNEANNGTMPLFLENAYGTYTIEASLLNTECDYLHLIDNLTGADVDLLTMPAYTFEGTTSDYASRFKLVFSISGEANKE